MRTQDTSIHSTSMLKYTYFFSFEGVNGYFLYNFIVIDSLYILWYTLEEAVYKNKKYWQYLLHILFLHTS
jgi:hypothetical protein